jgi:peptidoglycan/xylan/chitin deacetylase (PgdA/CDA1 family)
MPPARLVVYAASAGVAVMTVRAVLVRAPPLGWAVAMLAGYVALVLCGVFVLRLRIFVDAVVRGPRGARGVALTFDDGPHPLWTPRVLDILARHGATATFFLVGRKVEEHPEVVRAILDRGHAVGLHSHGHDRLFALRSERRVRADLERGVTALERVTGTRPVLFRPPIGHTNPIVARVADALDLTVVGWSIGGRDGTAFARPDDVTARVRRAMRDGAIVLLHDAPEHGDREPAAVRALPAILDAIEAQGLAVVPLAHWIDDSSDSVQASQGSVT